MTLSIEQTKNIALAIRSLSIDGVEAAKSGHPGLPLGAADFSAVLWGQFLKFNPQDPTWLGRDRFILSAGHGSMLVYSLLNLFGYKLPLEELKKFRQWGSLTPGHPEFPLTPGVEATTGPLGQGTANSVGMALSAKMLAARFGDLFDNKVFALVSDGDLMEGLSAEAAAVAGHLGLDNLIYLYDDNLISLAGPTSVCFSESIPTRYEGHGWWVKQVDGHDHAAVAAALKEAIAVKGKPKIICCRTKIGFGSPNRGGSQKAHGEPLGAEEAKLTKQALGLDPAQTFFIPEEATSACAAVVEQNITAYHAWNEKYKTWRAANADKAKELDALVNRTIPTALKDELIAAFKEGKKDATRNQSGAALQVIAKHVPALVGGSADLDPSTKTKIANGGDVTKESFAGRNIHFGVREHAMGSIANGMAYQRCWIPFTATFLTFSDYMRPTMRLAALSELQTLFIFTHDSIYLGEDGPTHQAVEHFAALRAIPHSHVYRPADGLEVGMSYYAALTHKDGPSTLIFTRQNLEPLAREKFDPDAILKGGYVVSGSSCTDLVIMATGSEVSLAVKVAEKLGRPCRIVSIPCVEAFKAQDAAYRESVLPSAAKKISIEVGISMGWRDLVGDSGLVIGLDRFGASAPAEVLAEKFGFTPDAIAERVKKIL